MSVKTWRFNALDTLFFKEARPMGSLGDSELQSVFPPPPRTVMGAIRSAIGEYNKVNWADYTRKAPNEDLSLTLIEEMGDSHGYGNMALKGLFLSLKKENENWLRLYPVPANLVATQEENKLKTLHFLTVGQPLHCDLGKNVRMAVAPELGIKTLSDYWITETGLNKVLLGQIPDISDLLKADDLYSHESRLGIGRNNLTRGVQKGLLYQTRHIRPHRCLSEEKININVAIEADIEGLSETLYPETEGIVRLGGEGRAATFEILNKIDKKQTESNSSLVNTADGITLILLSPLYIPEFKEHCPLPNFTKYELDNETVWKGEINQIALTLHCVMADKAVREGGWDLARNQPRPVQSFTPAGSVFYCTVDEENKKTIAEVLVILRNYQMNKNDSLGRGIITVGRWINTHKASGKK